MPKFDHQKTIFPSIFHYFILLHESYKDDYVTMGMCLLSWKRKGTLCWPKMLIRLPVLHFCSKGLLGCRLKFNPLCYVFACQALKAKGLDGEERQAYD